MIAARGYLKTAAVVATALPGDGPLVLLELLLRVLRVALLLAIWRVILQGRGAVSGLTLGAVLTYTLIAQLFQDQLTCRTELTSALWQGTIAMRLLWPLNTVGQFAAEMAGYWATGFVLFSLPLLLLARPLGVNAAPAGVTAGLLFLPSMLLAILVGLALEFIFAAFLVAFAANPWTVYNLRGAISAVFSGAVLPLALLPWGLGAVFGWLPFAAQASAPLRIYTGSGNAGLLLLSQAAWAALLWPLAAMLWRSVRERLAGFGG